MLILLGRSSLQVSTLRTSGHAIALGNDFQSLLRVQPNQPTAAKIWAA